MIAATSNGRCVTRAISTMRLALGYKKPLAFPIDFPVHGNQMPDIMGRSFPKHDILFFGDASEIGEFPKNVLHCGITIANPPPLDDYLWCFSYHSREEASHLVIGNPTAEGVQIYQIYGIQL